MDKVWSTIHVNVKRLAFMHFMNGKVVKNQGYLSSPLAMTWIIGGYNLWQSTFIYVSGITATCIMINETSNHFSSHKSEQKISSLYSIDSIDDDDRLHPLSYLIVLHSIYIFGQSITRLVSFEVIIMTENNQSSPPPYANYASSGT